jgi:light-regulated signal transduction histidine kinase (bacteriophytochrome)
MITAYSQLLIKSHPGEFTGEAHTFVDNIVDGTGRMCELLADLLAYTEIRTRDEVSVELLDLNTALEEVRQNLKAAIEESGAIVNSDRLPTTGSVSIRSTIRDFRGIPASAQQKNSGSRRWPGDLPAHCRTVWRAHLG